MLRGPGKNPALHAAGPELRGYRQERGGEGGAGPPSGASRKMAAWVNMEAQESEAY